MEEKNYTTDTQKIKEKMVFLHQELSNLEGYIVMRMQNNKISPIDCEKEIGIIYKTQEILEREVANITNKR